MEHNIISDLLPLYTDGVCSEESAACVRAHLEECAECRAALEDFKSGAASVPPRLDSSEIIKTAGRKVTAEAILKVTGISAIVLYWLIFAVMRSFADVGDYRYFSYTFWEIWHLGFIIMPAFTLIWLIRIIVKAAKQKAPRKPVAMLVILAVLLAGQIGFQYVNGHVMSTVSVGWIDEVNEGAFVFNNGAHPTEVSCSYELTQLLKTDGTMYVISYEHNRLFPATAKLSQIEEAGYNRSQSQWGGGG